MWRAWRFPRARLPVTRCLGQPLGEVGPFPARGAQSCGAWGRALVWEPGERPSPWSLLCLAPRKSLPVTSSVNWGEEDNAPSRNICSHVCEHLAERLVGIMHSACDHYLMLIKMISVLLGSSPLGSSGILKVIWISVFQTSRCNRMTWLPKKQEPSAQVLSWISWWRWTSLL